MATLDLHAVSKTYRSDGKDILAVDNLTLNTNDGEIIGLLGSSGCGKTTTLRAIAGFVQITSGEIRLNGANIHHLPPARRGVAMAFESYALYPPLRVRENIGFSLLREKKPGNEINQAVREIASLLNIEDILDKYPASTSAGQQQRTSLARALIRRAPITLLDEPMSQLEPQLRAIVRMRVKEYLVHNRLTTVFVTHDQNEAIALADRIAVMEMGVLQQFASVTELKNQPANLFVASFIGEPPMNIMQATVQSENNGTRMTLLHNNTPVGKLHMAGGEADHITDEVVHVGIRPHQVVFADNAPLRGKIISNQWLGDQTHVLVDIDGLCVVVVSPTRFRDLHTGENIGVDFPSNSVVFFSGDDGSALFRNTANKIS